jgi:glycosyltransferase involved in cell wall biosynthesis
VSASAVPDRVPAHPAGRAPSHPTARRPSEPAGQRPSDQDEPIAVAFSVVVPVYNEEDNVRPLLLSLRDVMEGMGQPYELIVVDDGSTDATRSRLRELTLELPALRVVQLRTNFGQTAALAAGFDVARGPLVITLDGDLQNDPVDIPRLVDKVKEGYDVVSGWRHDRQDPFWSRRLPSQVANTLISWITGVHLHDYGCALKVYRREILQDVALYGEMHRFLPALCRWVGATVGELPVGHSPRRRGVSKYGLGRMVRVLLDLLTVKFLMSYWTRPIQIFGLFGLLIGGLGIGVAAVLSYQKLFQAVGLANRPLLLLAVLLVLIGFQFVSIGLLGEMLVRTYHESQRKPVYTVREIISGGQS